ncbi:putative inactive receptor kinase [Panicum miliaceum]|uniref:Inactive receptor kinase n=1 Tax=Panicum miliaceum TaxID=4540 RepID=A0A3L6SPV2_PANMI|nr:putative inactive receptor kinase [Panicum miliaceum]
MCDGDAVVGVMLDGLGLSGELKLPTLAGMHALQNLSLAGNTFSGRLPPGIGTLSSLRHLDLSGNRFYGPMVGRLADLSGLVHLNLSHNFSSSGFPTDGIRQLQNLRRIDVRSNSFWGNARDLLTELRNAEYIDLSDNLFTGSVDSELDHLTSIGNTVKLPTGHPNPFLVLQFHLKSSLRSLLSSSPKSLSTDFARWLLDLHKRTVKERMRPHIRLPSNLSPELGAWATRSPLQICAREVVGSTKAAPSALGRRTHA